jgi:inhibitor of the pro-sigma K processing machinery
MSYMLDIDLNIILAFVFGLMVLYLLARILVYPMRILAKVVGNSLVGAVLLMIFNLLGGLVGLSVGVNVVSALVVGFLGLPGLITLLIIQGILS